MPIFNKTIQLFIFEGNPNGRIMCELSNWNGRVYKIARNQLSEFSQRTDSTYTGVYFLFGKVQMTTMFSHLNKICSRLVRLTNWPFPPPTG